MLLVLSLLAISGCASDELLLCSYAARQTDNNPTPYPQEIQPRGRCAARQSGGSIAVRSSTLDEIQFTEGLASLLVGGQWYYLTPEGRTAMTVGVDNGPDGFREGLARTTAFGKVGFIDKRLRVVISPRYDFAWPFEKGRAVVCVGCEAQRPDVDGHSAVVGGRWGCIDRSGAVVVPVSSSREEFRAAGNC